MCFKKQNKTKKIATATKKPKTYLLLFTHTHSFTHSFRKYHVYKVAIIRKSLNPGAPSVPKASGSPTPSSWPCGNGRNPRPGPERSSSVPISQRPHAPGPADPAARLPGQVMHFHKSFQPDPWWVSPERSYPSLARRSSVHSGVPLEPRWTPLCHCASVRLQGC